jgi:hypothetical protein
MPSDYMPVGMKPICSKCWQFEMRLPYNKIEYASQVK